MRLNKLPILLILSLIFAFAAFSVYAQEATPTVEPGANAPITLIPVATNAEATATDAVVTMVPVATTSGEATAEVTSEATVSTEATTEATAEATLIVVEASPTVEATTEATAEATTEATVEATAAAVPSDDNGAAPTGVGTLFLLIGVGAVLLVGGTMIARDNARNRSDGE